MYRKKIQTKGPYQVLKLLLMALCKNVCFKLMRLKWGKGRRGKANERTRENVNVSKGKNYFNDFSICVLICSE